MKMNNKGQIGTNAVEIAVGVILTVILVLGVAYTFVRNNASASALNITASAPEYQLVTYLPLFIVLIVFLTFVGFLIARRK